MASHAEPRPAERQRGGDTPQVDLAHSAAGEELAITVHVHVPAGYIVPDGFKADIASAVQAVVFPSPTAEEQDS